jgi:putative PIN family toxin of toxin-antitoxin system
VTPRAVFDCMVFVQALANDRGPSFACLQLARDGHVALCISRDVLVEVREVLHRPKLQRKLPALTAERADAFLDDVISYATLITDVPPRFAYGRDPKDEPYINLSLAAQARYLVSRDKDLLDLAVDSGFRQQFPGLFILDPVAFLQELGTASGKPGPGSERS